MRNAFIAAFLVAFAVTAFAADNEDQKCITVGSTTDAGVTDVTIDGGTCPWAKGSTVIMQCDQAVYFHQSGPIRTKAVSNDFKVDFTVNPDPYKIFLGEQNNLISTLGVSATATCKFSDSPRRKPW